MLNEICISYIEAAKVKVKRFVKCERAAEDGTHNHKQQSPKLEQNSIICCS